MADPTYNQEVIEANPVWDLAFVLSEIQNDSAPLGWSKYVLAAECLLARYEINKRAAPTMGTNVPNEGK